MTSEGFSTTLKHYSLPATAYNVEFTIKEDTWMMQVEHVGGSKMYTHVHIADPILEEMINAVWKWDNVSLKTYHDGSKHTVVKANFHYQEFVKFLERLEPRENIYDFEGGQKYIDDS